MIQVIVERDSVCMADDGYAPNEKKFWLDDEAQVYEIFKELSLSAYLPSIAGNNDKWDCFINDVLVCKFGKNIENPNYTVDETSKIKTIGHFNES
ncbi:hypothetical protein A9Q76_03660, partial [Arcobacter sp. 31_11_sub10_T18]